VIQLVAGLSIDASCLARWLFPGGLDGPRVSNPMPVPGEGVEA
jgi:hypothetical protein